MTVTSVIERAPFLAGDPDQARSALWRTINDRLAGTLANTSDCHTTTEARSQIALLKATANSLLDLADAYCTLHDKERWR